MQAPPFYAEQDRAVDGLASDKDSTMGEAARSGGAPAVADPMTPLLALVVVGGVMPG